MSAKLPTGLYGIFNVAHGQSPGHDLTKPTIKPIIGVNDKPIWVVEHVEADRYRLILYGFATKPEGNRVWGFLGPDVTGTEWILEPGQGPDAAFSIIKPPIPGELVHLWTLRERNAHVTLELREGPESGPNQLWTFLAVNEE
ncbi:hypothetical protein F5148DRAFT_1367414 [Russula earlei]|uniref:Uncharacterized protein n=2 Tax=Russula earlei TaxID=71964 RepID=A0ACC0U0K7_9AGAM|nr:hypothetical protein F5148DRAFT_1288725 [Russula earlei]KAI9509108.1 hypothetical protein F5148DRAFT_1367414 [Russula earlei]